MMTNPNLAHRRLFNQGLAEPHFQNPDQVVTWLGAVQSQDYAGAKWALAQRMTGATDASIEQAFTDGAILRTHILRPTWHFVAPADIRWMLELTASRVHAFNAYYYRQLELDDALLARTNALLANALQGGEQLTRAELKDVLQGAGIVADATLRLSYFVMYAELEGLICSGARRGKQFTYALLDERAPHARHLERDEALAELTKRFFMSHGPATLKDFVWWSSLTMADAKAGVALLGSQLASEVVDGQTFWFAQSTPLGKPSVPQVYLLPNYDEYTVAYADRSAIFDTQYSNSFDSSQNIVFSHTLVIDGQVAGTWQRSFKKGKVVIACEPFVPLTPVQADAFSAAAERYGTFLGMSVMME